MDESVYTLGVWIVKPGNEAAFISAWKELAAILLHLPHPPPADNAKLIQSAFDSTLFYSFGPWNDFSDIQAMRADHAAQAGITKLRELCSNAHVGNFEVVARA